MVSLSGNKKGIPIRKRHFVGSDFKEFMIKRAINNIGDET